VATSLTIPGFAASQGPLFHSSVLRRRRINIVVGGSAICAEQ
jgi:hypothetical protein